MTNSEFSKLLDKNLTGVATKKDLAALVTKKDARKFATKEDLKKMATKKGLGVVKKDLGTVKKDVRLLKNDIGGLKGDVGGLKKDLADFKVRFEFKLVQMEDRFDEKLEAKFSKYTNMVLDKMDQVMGQLQALREDGIFQQAQIEPIKQHVGLDV